MSSGMRPTRVPLHRGVSAGVAGPCSGFFLAGTCRSACAPLLEPLARGPHRGRSSAPSAPSAPALQRLPMSWRSRVAQLPGHRRVAVLVHHQEGEVGKDPQPAQRLPPSRPPPRATPPNPSAVRKPPAGPARSFGSPGRSPGASSPPPEGPGKPPSPCAGATPARGVRMAPRRGADRRRSPSAGPLPCC